MTKDFLAFKKYARTTKAKGNSMVVLEYLFETYNHAYGYSFVTFENMMKELKIASKETLTNAINLLEEEGIIVVNREFKNNRYIVAEIDRFLVDSNAKKVNKENVEKVEEVVPAFKPSQKFDNSKEVVAEEVVETPAEEVEIDVHSNEYEESMKVALVEDVLENKPNNKILALLKKIKEQEVLSVVDYVYENKETEKVTFSYLITAIYKLFPNLKLCC